MDSKKQYLAGLLSNGIMSDNDCTIQLDQVHTVKRICQIFSNPILLSDTVIQFESKLYNELREFKEFSKEYIRGVYESCSHVYISDAVMIKHVNQILTSQVLESTQTSFQACNDYFIIEGPNLLDFLHYIYNDVDNPSKIHYKRYVYLCNQRRSVPKFSYLLNDADAHAPSKSRPSDSGYDLTLINEKSRKGNVVFYDTGVAVKPPHGYYFDLVPRSSITKSGYILANGVGIIDQSYRGNIIVPLVKIDPNAPDLVLPSKLVQLIPRQFFHLEPDEALWLNNTDRGEKGFGSTGNSGQNTV